MAASPPPKSVYTADVGPRIFATVGGVVLSLVVLGTQSAPRWLRLGIWVGIGAWVGMIFVRAAGRRLEIYSDRVVIVVGRKRHEIAFREIEQWTIPSGGSLSLRLAGDQQVTITGWRRGADLIAELLTAIRVAGCRFEVDGKVHRVFWNE